LSWGVFHLAMAAIGLIVFLQIWDNPRFQWDFKAYYYAAKAWAMGLDPYDIRCLQAISGEEVKHRFFYPPITFYLFGIFSAMPYPVASRVWLLFKLACLALLILVWKKGNFLANLDSRLVSLVILFSFSSTVVWDLAAGNVAILEALLLWTGFLYFTRNQVVPCAAFILIASLFKLTPLAFLGLLLLPGNRFKTGFMALLAGIVVFSFLCLGPFAGNPQGFRSFWTSLGSLHETGYETPCAKALIEDWVHWTCSNTPGAIFGQPIPLPTLLWIAYLLGVAGLSLRPVYYAVKSGESVSVLMLAIILYALMVPRLKCYSYILLIVPLLFLLERVGRKSSPMIVGLPFCMPMYGSALKMMSTPLFLLFQEYYSFFLALAMWGLWIGCLAPSAGRTEGAEDLLPGRERSGQEV